MPTNETKIRRSLERAIVTAVVEECGKAGFIPVKVYGVREHVDTPDLTSVLGAVFSVYVSTIHFGRGPDTWGRTGVAIVLGNGEDCISDWHRGDKDFDRAVQAAVGRIENARVVL